MGLETVVGLPSRRMVTCACPDAAALAMAALTADWSVSAAPLTDWMTSPARMPGGVSTDNHDVTRDPGRGAPGDDAAGRWARRLSGSLADRVPSQSMA